ncbi:nonstructural protein [Microviridae sp.]|nr:nonstructural protein [Microviridae sp.]
MMHIYSIYDSVAKYYLPVFLANNDEEAKRMFIQSMDSNHRHRADYTLGSLGEWDRESGAIHAHDFAKIINGLSIPDNQFAPHPDQIQLFGEPDHHAPDSKEIQ